MPLLMLLVACLVAWIVLAADVEPPPGDLSLVVRVRDGAPMLELVLREAQRLGIGHLIIVDEGPRDGPDGVVAVWARDHHGVEVRRVFETDGLGASTLVLDLRGPRGASGAARTLRWLERAGRR